LPAKKLYYKMGEVTELTGLEAHVIRFWEQEFPQLEPKKSRTGHRNFTRGDIDTILEIKRLVHEQGFTLAGAKKKLAGEDDGTRSPEAMKQKMLSEIREIRGVLENVINMLDRA